MPSADDLLALYIKQATETSRSVEITSDVGEFEIIVSRTSIRISSSFIGSETKLTSIAERTASLIEEFDTKQERECARICDELEDIITARFSRLLALDSERAHILLHQLQNGAVE